MKPNAQFWSGKSVLVTGHTGFKGGWLVTWLSHLGADVSGFALAPDTQPNLFTQLNLRKQLGTDVNDLRDKMQVEQTLAAHRPEVIFHLAAQPLVRESYRDPLETFATNVMGTANLLDVVRSLPSVKAVVVVTTDKCYENVEWIWPYREDDRLGGRDPYSASKACAELVARSFHDSFLVERGVHIATARAGNVLGGGDWAKDRLVPDCVRAALKGEKVVIRNPKATRPWQHVLEPLLGYILLAERLHEGVFSQFEAFNFGPHGQNVRPVSDVATKVMELLGGKIDLRVEAAQLHEAMTLNLDSSKAAIRLGWHPRLNPDNTLRWTTDWYRAVSRDQSMAAALTLEQIKIYENMDRAI